MSTHKPFRELIQPGSNFEFIGKQRLWFSISLLMIAASFAAMFVNKSVRGDYLNWSTDFKGGTEIILSFHQAGSHEPVEVDPGKVRQALLAAGHDGIDVSDFTWEEEAEGGATRRITGLLVRTPAYGAVAKARQSELAVAFVEQFKDRQLLKATWSGDRLFVRSMQPLDWAAASKFFADAGLTLKPWDLEGEAERFTTAEEGTGEFHAQLAIRGIDAQYQEAVAASLTGVDVGVVNVYGVGAKAGEKLRNDGVASLFYALALIMLYLVVRFDIRYAPGAVIALLHDAFLVIGVFAATWTEVSLVTVAAILTVIGYSVNDTVIIFDRIRENVARLKDKKFARIMNISINETLSRSLLTSSTVFVTSLAMNIFSTGLVRNFAFAMNIGVVVGTYSSIFIASPLVLWIHNRWYAGGDAPGRASRLTRSEEAEEVGDEAAAEV